MIPGCSIIIDILPNVCYYIFAAGVRPKRRVQGGVSAVFAPERGDAHGLLSRASEVLASSGQLSSRIKNKVTAPESKVAVTLFI